MKLIKKNKRERVLQKRVANFRNPRAPVPLADTSIALLGSSHDMDGDCFKLVREASLRI